MSCCVTKKYFNFHPKRKITKIITNPILPDHPGIIFVAEIQFHSKRWQPVYGNFTPSYFISYIYILNEFSKSYFKISNKL